MKKPLTQITPLGRLHAFKGVDPEYPSIDLFWGGRLIASLECSPADPADPESEKRMRVLIWNTDDDNESPLSVPIEPAQPNEGEAPAAECAECEEIRTKHKGFGPRHNGSRFCESGSIASGGTKAHCTCDWCF